MKIEIKLIRNQSPANPRKKTLMRIAALLALFALVLAIPASAKYVGQGDAVFSTELDSLVPLTTADIPAAGTGLTAMNKESLVTADAIINMLYPKGSIYMSTDPTNPADRFPGTSWQAWGQGRVPLGAGTWTDSETETRTFTVAPLATYTETSGGTYSHLLTTAQMPSHTHTQDAHGHTANHTHDLSTTGSSILGTNYSTNIGSLIGGVGNGGYWNQYYFGSLGIATANVNTSTVAAVNQNTGGGNAHPNVQPYVTCYMWRRTG